MPSKKILYHFPVRFFYLSLFVLVFLAGACRKEDVFTTDSSARLSFNRDKVQFDTVFTMMGSATKNFKVKNTNKNGVRTNIRLGKGKESLFRINVDGKSGTEFQGKELPGGDSMYVFVEVTVDPKNQNTPFVVSDSVIFETNGNIQYVKLEAWGQEAVYIGGGKANVLFGTFSTDRPYVILDYAIVPSGETLILPKGTKFHFHSGAVLDVWGTLIIQGDNDKPVIFQGDRLEQEYGKAPGQWGGIFFRPGSSGNQLTHAIIQNAAFGIFDSFYNGIDVATQPKLALHQCILRNFTNWGILALNSWINMDNVLIYNTGKQAFFADGGKYNVIHSTFDNSNSDFVRQFATVSLTDQILRSVTGGPDVSPKFQSGFFNCIIYGSEDDEIDLVKDNANTVNATLLDSFSHCVVKSKKYNFTGTNTEGDPGFFSSPKGDYHLRTSSSIVGKGAGDTELPYHVPTDLEDKAWSQRSPGCYTTTK